MDRLCCGFTGHRPKYFPWAEDDPRQAALLRRLREAILSAYAEGCRDFLSGGAQGVDTWAAELVLELRPDCPGMELELVLPFAGYNRSLPPPAQARMERVRTGADRLVVLSGEKSVLRSLRQRDRYIAEHSDLLLAVYDERSGFYGGTRRTLEYARARGVPVVQIRWMELTD